MAVPQQSENSRPTQEKRYNKDHLKNQGRWLGRVGKGKKKVVGLEVK